jgi:hypothetical protein
MCFLWGGTECLYVIFPAVSFSPFFLFCAAAIRCRGFRLILVSVDRGSFSDARNGDFYKYTIRLLYMTGVPVCDSRSFFLFIMFLTIFCWIWNCSRLTYKTGMHAPVPLFNMVSRGRGCSLKQDGVLPWRPPVTIAACGTGRGFLQHT